MGKFQFWLLMVLLLVGLESQATPRQVNPRCQKIVSLSPSITSILTDLQLTDHIIGATRYCLLPETHPVPSVGGYFDLNYEAVVALKPSLVVMQGGQNQTSVKKLKQLGVDVESIMLDTLDDILASYSIIEDICGVDDKIEHDVIERLQAIKARFESVKSPRVLLFYGKERDYTQFIPDMAVGKSFHSDLLSWLLIENTYQGPLNAPILSVESIYRLNPDWIIILKPNNAVRFAEQNRLIMKQVTVSWPLLIQVSAIKKNQVYEIQGVGAMLPTPLAMLALAEALADILLQSP